MNKKGWLIKMVNILTLKHGQPDWSLIINLSLMWVIVM